MTEDDELDPVNAIMENGPRPQRMIVIKTIGEDVISAEDSEGQMIFMDLREGTVKTLLMEDTDWVHGELTNVNAAWEIIGYYFGLTDGHMMDRVRNVTH